jgi:hypothetical protein
VRLHVRTVFGSLIAVAALGLFLFGLFQLVRGGSCASGGNYVSTRQCPSGSTAWMFVLPVALLVGLGGIWLVASGRSRPRTNVPTIVSTTVRTAPPVFLRPELFVQASQPVGVDTGDPISRLERLQALRDSGALSPEEFQRAKAMILAEM